MVEVARIRQLCGCKCLESLPRCPLRTGAGEKASEVEAEGLLRIRPQVELLQDDISRLGAVQLNGVADRARDDGFRFEVSHVAVHETFE